LCVRVVAGNYYGSKVQILGCIDSVVQRLIALNDAYVFDVGTSVALPVVVSAVYGEKRTNIG